MFRWMKQSWVLTILLLSSLALAACGDATPTANLPTATVSGTASPTTTAGVASTAKKLKIGLVTDVGRIDDHGYQQAAWEGLQQVQQNLGSDIKYIETKDTSEFATNIDQFVKSKQDVIVTVGPSIGDTTYAAAKANPDILFVGIDQPQTPDKQLKNYASLVFDEDKAGFLAGVLAAGMSQQGNIGAILGPKEFPQLAKFGEGFKAGAAYLDANYASLVKAGHTAVNLIYHPNGANAFTDPAWGVQQAQTLVQSKADVIFGAAGATGSAGIEVAASQNVNVIGVDSDQYYTLPKAAPHLLSSATKLVGVGLVKAITAIQSGSFQPGNLPSPVGLAPYHDMDKQIPDALKQVIQKVNDGLNNGTLQTGVKINS